MFHKEGYKIIFISLFISAIAIILINKYIHFPISSNLMKVTVFVLLGLILQFFRNPKRNTIPNSNQIIAPVDGKVVVIEEVVETEYFNDKRRQISIFMSPLNVHVTRYPISGKVNYSKYHPGKYLVAWHPKSSTENERTTIVVENNSVGEILYRQVAGALARRIVNYAKKDATIKQGKDAGFIKFGSRVDIFIPLDMKITVNLDQVSRGGETVIAELA
ncbi:MAG: phosphatidylserine decarboxylase family protein [Flavobacteriaceae bacterium]